MQNALGIEPAHYAAVGSSELCGTCHTVHLPVMNGGKVIGYTYEQTTYPEWAFSDYRTGESPDGPLPGRAGPKTEANGLPGCRCRHWPLHRCPGTPGSCHWQNQRPPKQQRSP